MVELEDILNKVQVYRPGEDLGLLRKAYEFTAQHHQGQTRLSGEPFVTHPLEVVNVLADMKLDLVCLAGGMLHDVVEDTSTTPDRIRQEFGPEVARIVEGVTKIGRIRFSSPEEQQAENYRKMVLPKSACGLRARRLRFTLPSRTDWAWARCAANWRISLSATLIRKSSRR
jgi:guanosine-3',5'-bis(diphosphate) 3'-pyrophosphohydrolase